MDQSAKICHCWLYSGVKTEQPLMAQNYKPNTITIRRPWTKREHINKIWIHNSTIPNECSQVSISILFPAKEVLQSGLNRTQMR